MMEPAEVKGTWPEAWDVMANVIQGGGNIVEAIHAGRLATGVGLIEAKRIAIAIRDGTSLESFQESLFDSIIEVAGETETHDDRSAT